MGVNHEMIVLGRESRRLTQIEFASRVPIEQARLSRIESGLMSVPDDVLQRFAKTLDYPENFFSFQDVRVGLGPSGFYHRKKLSLSPKLLRYIHAQVSIRCLHVSQLLRRGSIQVNVPKMDVDEYGGNAEEIARAVRAAWLLPPGPINSVMKAIESHGGIIIRMDFGTHLIDGLSIWPMMLPPLFFVNEQTSVDRQRFSLCHELGHIVMHGLAGPDIKEREAEANRFAGEFLLPAKEVRSHLTNLSLPKLATLKQHWKVSMAAILEHAFRLNKISARKRQYLWSQMGHAGYQRHEPLEPDGSKETPSLLQQIINGYRYELQFSVSDLAKVIGLHEKELRTCYLDEKPKLSLVS